MASNRPYEESNGFGSLVMAGIISTGAAGIYTKLKHPDTFNGIMNKVIDTVTTKVTQDPTEIRQNVIKANRSLREKEGIAGARNKLREAEYTQKYTSIVNEIDSAGGGVSIEAARGAVDVASADAIGFSKSRSQLDNLSRIKSSTGESIGFDIVNEQAKRFGVSASDVELLEGTTTARIKVGNKEVFIPMSMKDAHGSDIIITKNGARRAAPKYADFVDAGESLGLDINGFNDIIRNSTEDVVLGEKGSFKRGLFWMNSRTDQRDVVESRFSSGKAKTKKVEDVIKQFYNKIKGDFVVQNLDSVRATNDVFSSILGTTQLVQGNSAHVAQEASRRVYTTPHSAAQMEFHHGREGFYEDAMAIDNVSTFDGSVPKISNAVIESKLNVVKGIRADPTLMTIGGRSLSPTEQWMAQNLGYTLGQGQTAKGIMSMSGTQAVSPYVEVNKSLNKNWQFTANEHIGNPLMWNPEVESHSPVLFGNYKKNIMTMNSVMLPGRVTERGQVISHGIKESMLFTDEAYAKMGVKRDIGFTGVKTFMPGGVSEGMMDVSFNGSEGIERMTLGELMLDERKHEVSGIFGKRGSIIGETDQTGHIVSGGDLDAIHEIDGRLMRSKFDFRISGEQWKQTLAGNGEVYASIYDRAAKAGSAYGNTRSVVELASGEIGTQMKKFTLHNSGAVEMGISREMYEKAFTKTVNGVGSVAQKDIPNLIPFMIESIAGHMQKGNKLKLGKDTRSSFSKMLNNPNALGSGAISSELFETLQFNPSKVGNAESFETLTRILGGIRGQYAEDTWSIGDKYGYDEAAQSLSRDFASYGDESFRAKPWFLRQGLVTHETALEQGIGTTTYRMGMKDNPFLIPEVLSELSLRNIAPTTKINSEYTLMKDSLRGLNVEDAIQKAGMPILDGDGLGSLLKNIDGAGDLSDPNLFKGSLLDREANPNGFALRTEDGGLRTFGSADLYQGGQFLGEDEKIAYQQGTKAELRELIKIKNNGGIVNKEIDESLTIHRHRDFYSPKGGPLRQGAIQARGAIYGKNSLSPDFLNNEQLIAQLKGNAANGEIFDKLYQIHGNTTYMDHKVYQSLIHDELSEVNRFAKAEGMTFHDALVANHGDDNYLLNMIKAGGGDSEGVLKSPFITTDEQIGKWSKGITERSVSIGESFEELTYAAAHGGQDSARAAVSLAEGLGQTALLDRYPHVGFRSSSLGMVYAKDMGLAGADKTISLGHILRRNLNADNDGDKLFALLFHMKETREATKREIMGAQKITAEFMDIFKEKNALKAAMGSGNELMLPAKAHISQLLNTIHGMEVESAKAAYATKMMTGSANIRAHEIRNSLMETINASKATGSSLEAAMSFAYALPGQNIEQSLLSSKHLETNLATSDNKLSSLFRNIGNVSESEFKSGLVALGGEVSPIHMFAAMHGARSTTASYKPGAKWLSPGNVEGSILGDIKTMMNMSTQWRDSTDAELQSLFKLSNSEMGEQEMAQRIASYREETKDTSWIRDSAAMKDSGLAEHENMYDLFEQGRKSSKGRLSDTFDSSLQNANRHYAEHIAENPTSEKTISHFMTEELAKNESFMRHLHSATLGNPELASEFLPQTSRELKGWSRFNKAIEGKITPRNLGIGAAGVTLAVMVTNLLSGDGSPSDINDLPSVNNPSMEDHSYNSMHERRSLGSNSGNNVSMDLITSNRNYNDSMAHAQGVTGIFDTSVSVRHDGTNPYSSDMHQYS